MQTTTKRLIAVIAAAGATCCMMGADTIYTWTGGANDGGLWTSPANWGRESGYPNGSDAVVVFDGGATVSLDTGTDTPIKLLKVTDGVVTLNGTAGSRLKATYATAGYDELFNVATNNTLRPDVQLILNVPVNAGGLRCDKWYGGTLVFRSDFTNALNNTGGFGFIFGSGSNILENACRFYCPNSKVALANGPAAVSPLVLRITDGSQLTAKSLLMPSRSSNTQDVDMLQEDADTVVTIGGDIELGYNTAGAQRWARYRLIDGRMAVAGDILCGKVSNGYFEMSGGTLELGGSFKKNTAGATGGRFIYSGGRILAKADRTGVPVPEWAEANDVPRIGAVAGATLSIDSWERPYPIRTVGEGLVLIPDDTSMTITNDVIVEEGTFKLGSRIHLDAPSGDYTPWKIKISSGATLRFTDITSRISRPLDLEIEEGGKVHFPNNGDGDNGAYMRSMLIAHKLTVGGVVMGKGRYGATDWFTAYAGASIVVPFVWTGAAGDGLWETAGNWENGQLPVGGSTDTIVDLSQADGQTITITNPNGYMIGGVIANPNGSTRKVTVKGKQLMIQNKVTGNCAFYVGEGCELVMDCDYSQSSGPFGTYSNAAGGGRIRFLRNYPDLGASTLSAPLCVDATLVFAGTNMTTTGGSALKQFLLGGCVEKAGYGRAIIEDGAKITANRFQSTTTSTSPMAEVIQRGGTITVAEFALGRTTSTYSSQWPIEYRFEGGEISCSSGFYMGVYIANIDNGWRYTHGTFLMTGGVLTTPLVKTAANTQYLRFYGGTVNLGSGGMVLDTSSDHYGSHSVNSDPVHLGGVKIRATADSVSDVSLVLDGKNGDSEIDTDGHDMTFSGTVSGGGGLVKKGLGTVTFAGDCTFGGMVVVKGGSVVFDTVSSLHADSIAVENGTLSILGAVDAGGLSLRLCNEQALTLPASGTISVARLIVGGEQRAAGSYSIGGGTVTVVPPAPGAGDAVWIGESGGGWNVAGNWQDGNIPNGDTATADFGLATLASNTTINLDADVTLKKLAFGHPEEGAKLTIGANGGILNIVSGATITVERGRTLEIAANVVMGPNSGGTGNITVNGGGTLRFSGKVTPTVPVTNPATFGTMQVPRLEMAEGVLDFAGEVEGVRTLLASSTDTPRLVFSDGMIATNKFAPNIAWAGERMLSEIVQNGGVFGLDATIPDFPTGFKMGYPRSGTMSYTLNNGLFRMNKRLPTSFDYYSGGLFLFTVNGGVVEFCNYIWGGSCIDSREILTLNAGGRFRFLNGFGVSKGIGILVLNGGRIESAFTGTLIADSALSFVELNGNVVFAQDDAAEQVTIENQIEGLGSIEQQGPGNLIVGKASPGIASASVTGGTLTFADMMSCTNCMVGANAELRLAHAGALMPGAVASVAGSGTLNLDFDEGVLVLDRLTVGGCAVRRGEYGTGTGRPLPPGLEGNGMLRILHGAGGMTIYFH